MAGFRRRLVKLAIELNLHGFVLNDNYDGNRVCAMVQGASTGVFSFISATELLMSELGVEIKVQVATVADDVLPSPFFRMPNSVADEEDRFDKAIAILLKMSNSLESMNKSLIEVKKSVSVLPEMKTTQDEMKATIEEHLQLSKDNHQEIMQLSKDNHQEIMQLSKDNHQEIMELSRDNHQEIMELSRDNHQEIMQLSLNCHGEIKGILNGMENTLEQIKSNDNDQ